MKATDLSHIHNNDVIMNITTSNTRSILDGNRASSDPYGFVRYRENSVSSDLGTSMAVGNITGVADVPNENDIAKFCKESNYSYSFATILGMKRLSYVRRRSCERNLDCVRLIRNKLDDLDSGRRYSQPDIGVMDKQRSHFELMTHQQHRTSTLKQKGRHQHFHTLSTNHSHNGGSTGTIRHDKNNSQGNNNDFGDIYLGNHISRSTYTSLPASPIFWDYGPDHESSIPEENESGTAALDDSVQQQHPSTIIHPLSCQTATVSLPLASYYCPNSEMSVRPSMCKTIDVHLQTLSTGSASSCSKSSSGVTNNIAAHTRNHNVSCASRYLRALHTPTRFLPQQQAILSTDADGNLLLFNDIACLCLGIDKSYVGRSIFNKFDGSAQYMVSHRLQERKKQLQRRSILLQRQQLSVDQSDVVLMCGVIIPIIKTKEQKSAASLWLKEKWNKDQGRFVYLWIFEELFESRLSLTIDNKGMIQNTTLATIEDIYGYHKREVIGRPINKILPSLNIESTMARDLVNKNRFYGSRSKNGEYFPSMVQVQENKLQITSLPTISGLITIHQNGMIQSMNPVPAKYLFGYKDKDVVETMHIDKLVPQFMKLVSLLDQQRLLRHDRMVTFEECMDILCQSSPNTSTPTTTSIIAVHRDGSQFDVELEIRWVESGDENLYSVWITYNRINSITPRPATISTDDGIPDETPNTTLSTSRASLQQHSTLTTSSTEHPPIMFPTNANITPPANANGMNKPEFDPKCGAVQRNCNAKQQEQQRQQNGQSTKSTFSRFERFGSVPNDIHNGISTPQSALGPSSILFPEFDDYVVIDSLGEGTYGSVSLVYSKSDPSQEYVIKAIMKSRIIVDSWVRDRKHGSIPIEIHILLKLQQHLHVNCPQLITFFEDDDNYYTVTKLHGDGMDLFDYIELNDDMTEGQVRRIFYQVAAAVQHLHHLRIVHRDIKDENILLNENGIVQLIDFGSAAYYREGRLFDTFSGTLDHSSPEVLNGTPYTGPPQDMWSLGVLLYTLIYRETPFYSVDDIMERNLQLPYVPYPEKGNGPVDLLFKLLDKDINKRPTIDQVMQDPWFQNES